MRYSTKEWRDKEMKVFVTGASGFVGSHLVPKLIERNLEIYALERYMTGRFIQDKHDRVVTVYGDLNDHVVIREHIADIQPEYVIHLASISPVSYSFDHPFEVNETNYIASMNLAEVNRKYNHNLQHFLVAGTSEEYGVQEEFPIPETADLRPNTPYAVSKVAMDRYMQYLRDAYSFPMTLLRPFNTYGRKDNTHFVMERIISQMLADKPFIQLGDPSPVRDLMYIDDHVDAYLTCLDNPEAKEKTFNFCTGRGVSISDLVSIIAKEVGYGGGVKWGSGYKRPTEIPILIGDYSKAERLLGWKPTVSLETGVRKIIEHLTERTPYVRTN